VRYRLADLFLDTLPFNAHATANDALWMGLPVLTRQGGTFASRVASSLLTAIGLPELITASAQDYEALALQLATTPALLMPLRSRLARNRSRCSLFDSERYCRHLEIAYTTMWHRTQHGEAPEHFAVPVLREP
jgi:protein O-GlcNAc transferase